MQIKPPLRYHHTPTKTTKIKKIDNTQCGEGMEHPAGGSVEWENHMGKLAVSNKTYHTSAFWSSKSTHRHSPKRNKVYVHTKRCTRMFASSVAKSCLTFCDPMDCSLPGSSVHGIFQARILQWVAFPSPMFREALNCKQSKHSFSRDFLAVQWLRLHAPNTRSTSSIPGQGTKIPQYTRCTQNK